MEMLLAPFLAVDCCDENEKNKQSPERQLVKDHTDPFQLPDIQFIELFKLNKDAAMELLQEISPHMKDDVRKTFIPKSIRLVAALHFYGKGSCLKEAVQNFECPLSKPMVCRSVHEVTYAIQKEVMPKYIKFPTSMEEKNRIQQRFFECTGFPGVLGAVGGTHVKIKKPSGNLAHSYNNHRGFYSKNVLLICDYDLNVLEVKADDGGALESGFFWQFCESRRLMYQNYEQNKEECWLIAGREFSLEPILMNPYIYHHRKINKNYNAHHLQALNCVERLKGVLKTVFGCLSTTHGLQVDPDYAEAIINVCATLHNFRKKYNMAMPDVNVPYEQNMSLTIESECDDVDQNAYIEGAKIRDKIAKKYFK